MAWQDYRPLQAELEICTCKFEQGKRKELTVKRDYDSISWYE